LAVTTNSGMTDEVLSVSSSLQYQEEWKLDSGASHHMCSHRNWFISYQSVDEGVVFMGNGIPCKIVGVGIIRIRMFDGIVRELMDVRFVPELKINLISLGVLDSGGYKYTGQGGALKVSKGSLVVMKETKIDNLYKLEGSTEVESEVTYVSSCLWQKQQGHMSKKGLQNCKLLPDLESLFLNFCLYYISASYDDGEKGCRVWDPTSHKIVINRDIVFIEQP
jgi:hypothetical protein